MYVKIVANEYFVTLNEIKEAMTHNKGTFESSKNKKCVERRLENYQRDKNLSNGSHKKAKMKKEQNLIL